MKKGLDEEVINLLPGEALPTVTGTALAASGQLNPAFHISDIKADYLVIAFMSMATPVVDCSLVMALRKSLPEFRRLNAEVVGITADSTHTIQQYFEKSAVAGGFAGKPNFVIISDKTTLTAKAFGVKRPSGMIAPSFFIFDKNRRLRYRSMLVHYVGHNVKEIVNILRDIKTDDDETAAEKEVPDIAIEESSRQKWITFWAKVIAYAIQLWSLLINAVTSVVEKVINYAIQLWTMFTNAMTSIIEKVTNYSIQLWTLFINTATSAIGVKKDSDSGKAENLTGGGESESKDKKEESGCQCKRKGNECCDCCPCSNSRRSAAEQNSVDKITKITVKKEPIDT